jgi:hypothetical protein
VTPQEILEVLACPDVEVEPPLDVMLPDHLVPPERLAADMQVGFCWGARGRGFQCARGGGGMLVGVGAAQDNQRLADMLATQHGC